MTKHYFLLRRTDRGVSHDWQHMYIVIANHALVPDERINRYSAEIIGATSDPAAMEAIKNLHMNSAMRCRLEAGGYWPVVEGWR